MKVGGIEQTGSSKLGPLALVPCLIRYQDGSVRENWMVVQFRETDQGASCVIAGVLRGYNGLNVKGVICRQDAGSTLTGVTAAIVEFVSDCVANGNMGRRSAAPTSVFRGR